MMPKPVAVACRYPEVSITQGTHEHTRSFSLHKAYTSGPLVTSVDDDRILSLTSEGRRVFYGAQRLVGVERVAAKGDVLMVTKGVAFEWDEVAPRVLRLLRGKYSGKPEPAAERIVAEDPPNIHSRVYHTTTPLVSRAVCVRGGEAVSRRDLVAAGPKGARVLAALARIDGVGELRFGRYHVRVDAVRGVHRVALESEVTAVLRDAFPPPAGTGAGKANPAPPVAMSDFPLTP